MISGSWESPVCSSSSLIFVYTCRQTLQLPSIEIKIIISSKIIIIIKSLRSRPASSSVSLAINVLLGFSRIDHLYLSTEIWVLFLLSEIWTVSNFFQICCADFLVFWSLQSRQTSHLYFWHLPTLGYWNQWQWSSVIGWGEGGGWWERELFGKIWYFVVKSW